MKFAPLGLKQTALNVSAATSYTVPLKNAWRLVLLADTLMGLLVSNAMQPVLLVVDHQIQTV